MNLPRPFLLIAVLAASLFAHVDRCPAAAPVNAIVAYQVSICQIERESPPLSVYREVNVSTPMKAPAAVLPKRPVWSAYRHPQPAHC